MDVETGVKSKYLITLIPCLEVEESNIEDNIEELSGDEGNNPSKVIISPEKSNGQRNTNRAFVEKNQNTDIKNNQSPREYPGVDAMNPLDGKAKEHTLLVSKDPNDNVIVQPTHENRHEESRKNLNTPSL